MSCEGKPWNVSAGHVLRVSGLYEQIVCWSSAEPARSFSSLFLQIVFCSGSLSASSSQEKLLVWTQQSGSEVSRAKLTAAEWQRLHGDVTVSVSFGSAGDEADDDLHVTGHETVQTFLFSDSFLDFFHCWMKNLFLSDVNNIFIFVCWHEHWHYLPCNVVHDSLRVHTGFCMQPLHTVQPEKPKTNKPVNDFTKLNVSMCSSSVISQSLSVCRKHFEHKHQPAHRRQEVREYKYFNL